MRILEGIEPRAVFEHFEEICRIPHGSGNIQMISDHLVSFAQKRNLKYRQDQYGNVIIWKEGSKGYEDSAPVILQSHMDMVAVKDEDVEKDMEKEAIDLVVDGDYIYAEGTSLGADNGVGLSYILAVLSGDDLSHPPIEAVFTVDEENGLVGAGCIEVSDLKGKMMINVDAEKEGTLVVSSAGGAQADLYIPFKEERITGTRIRLHMDGFKGGHSGVNIKKGTLNAIRAMGRVLYGLSGLTEICLISINGGDRDNAIPVWCEAELILCGKEADEDTVGKRALDCAHEIFDTIREEYEATDPEIKLSCAVTKGLSCNAFTKEDTNHLIAALINLPCGVQRRNPQIPNMVQTSLNMGVVRTLENEVKIVFGVRSASASETNYLLDRLKAFAELLGGTVTIHGVYPGWDYRALSRVRDMMVEAYVDLYGEEPVVDGVHAGVECALFSSKIPDLDAISAGPDLFDIHTTKERMSIESAGRTWQLLIRTLEKLK